MNVSATREIRQVHDLEFSTDHRRSSELGSDRPGRSVESHGTARHAIEPKTDPHRELKRAFADQLVDVLTAHLEAKEFDRLILVAPPKMLGDLRQAIGQGLRAHITGEVGQDLTKVPNSEVADHLAGVVVL